MIITVNVPRRNDDGAEVDPESLLDEFNGHKIEIFAHDITPAGRRILLVGMSDSLPFEEAISILPGIVGRVERRFRFAADVYIHDPPVGAEVPGVFGVVT